MGLVEVTFVMVTPLDPALVALASCPVIHQEKFGGHIVFNPYPAISASDDLVLSHEICHKLSGVENFNKFVTACHVRNNKAFDFVLNCLVDWYDERRMSSHSMYLQKRVEDLHATVETDSSWPDEVKELQDLYLNDVPPKDFPDIIDGIEDLIVYADGVVGKVDVATLEVMIQLGAGKGNKKASASIGNKNGKLRPGRVTGASSDVVPHTARGDFYLKTVAKYNYIIDTVSQLWLKNKYKWTNAYFGEVNYKNLPGLLLGDKMGLPVYKLLKKLDISRGIYLTVDRSGSTGLIRVPVMETAVIITESFRRVGVPVSILDVGSDNCIVNKITEPLDFDWFVPLNAGGTPLGQVCSQIENSQPDDYLLIITDGQPDSWEQLGTALTKFRGNHLTFVIGSSSFRQYYEKTKGHACLVEPGTIVRELINDKTLSC